MCQYANGKICSYIPIKLNEGWNKSVFGGAALTEAGSQFSKINNL